MAAVVASGSTHLRSPPRNTRDNSRLLAQVKPLEPVDNCNADGCIRCRRLDFDDPEDLGFRNADWDDVMESQLRELLLNCLDTIYKNAVRKIAACGYSEEAAIEAVLMSGTVCRSREDAADVLGDALSALRDRGGDTDEERSARAFRSLEEMEKHVLEEMVELLREARPDVSSGDAMWCLLVCDMVHMDAHRALGNDVNPLGGECGGGDGRGSEKDCGCGVGYGGLPGYEGFDKLGPSLEGVLQSMIGMPDFPCRKSSGTFTAITKCSVTQSGFSAESLLSMKKGQSSRSKRDSLLRQKYLHIEKTYQMYGCSKGSSRGGRVNGPGSLMQDKKCRSVLDPNGMNVKAAMMKIGKAIRSNISQGDGIPMVSSVDAGDRACAASHCKMYRGSSMPVGTKIEAPLETDNGGIDSSKSDIPKDVRQVRSFSDGTDVQSNPHDKKDEIVLTLTRHIYELQLQLDEWKRWAQQKVMQAAQRLRKDRAEIQILRQSKDEVGKQGKENQTVERSSLKKYTEMENALSKVGDQMAWANGVKCGLEVANTELQMELEAAKLRAAKSVDSYDEATRREIDIVKKVQSLERQNSILQEEAMNEKHKLSELQEKLNQAVKYHHQLEVSLRQEEKLKNEVLTQAKVIAKEHELMKKSAKSNEDLIKRRAYECLQRHMQSISKLEEQINGLRRNTCIPNKVTPSWGVDGGGIPTSGVINFQCISELASFQEPEWEGYNVLPEHECVMCLMEEKSVLFLPCAHQVICLTCNGIHEKQGMKDCPSCRTLIQRRIPVRFPSPRPKNIWDLAYRLVD